MCKRKSGLELYQDFIHASKKMKEWEDKRQKAINTLSARLQDVLKLNPDVVVAHINTPEGDRTALTLEEFMVKNAHLTNNMGIVTQLIIAVEDHNSQTMKVSQKSIFDELEAPKPPKIRNTKV